MSDEWLRDAYERALPANDATPSLDDVSAERLRRLVEGEGSESERLRTLDMTLSTAEGRRELEIVWAAARAARPRRRSWWRYAAAAGLVVAIGGSVLLARARRSADDGAGVVRGADSPVTLVAPVGEVEAVSARRFLWRPVGRAERYQLVVVDTAGNEIFAGETADTALTLPDTVHLDSGRAYLWWVQARLADQSTVTAVTQRVVVTR
jgi:hypothetical protein